MALRIYEYNGGTYQFTEGEQPDGAVEWSPNQPAKVAPVAEKAKALPRNKRAPDPANK